MRGLNGAGPGQASNEARFRVGEVPACDAPRPPVLLPATVIGRIVTLAWRAPGNVAVGAYRLLVGSAPGGSDLAVLDVGPVTSFVATAPPGVLSRHRARDQRLRREHAVEPDRRQRRRARSRRPT